MIRLELADKEGLAWAQRMVTKHHYLHKPVDARCSNEAYLIYLSGGAFGAIEPSVGCLIFGRPEATRCSSWYGSVEDVQEERCEVTRWQVLNLSRVFLVPEVQAGGKWHTPFLGLPGFTDRRGQWRSTLASEAIKAAIQCIGYEYLLKRPPCFLDEPYELKYLLSYCDTRLHKGTIYAAAGFERYRINKHGIETWRIRLPVLTPEQDAEVRQASADSPRSRRYRAERAAAEAFTQQVLLPLMTTGEAWVEA